MKFQITMLNVLLLVTAIAVGFALWLQRSENEMHAQQLPSLQNEARELVVEDPSLIHVVEPHPTWFNEEKWSLHIPDQPEFKIMLLTEGIQGDETDIASYSPEQSAILPSGRHAIEQVENKLSDETYELTVLLDDKPVFIVSKDKFWKSGDCSISNFSQTGECKSFSNEETVVLNHSRIEPINQVVKPDDKLNGILLWIEKSVP